MQVHVDCRVDTQEKGKSQDIQLFKLVVFVMLRQKFRQGLATKRPLKATERP